jgi:hypothetical protein
MPMILKTIPNRTGTPHLSFFVGIPVEFLEVR